uniref:Integrin subunit beta 3 binding protein n=1 Tax=Nothoprocta perdicaria TaxID=30464 RepID=A0A8C6YLL1_NOTPE
CRVKRALKLDTIKKDNVTTPLKTKKKNLNSYSPTTGTCQMSPFSSPTSHNIVFNLLCRFMELQSKVKNSLAKILKIRENLKSLQALEGSRELENIIGVSDLSCILSAEMQKTQVLMRTFLRMDQVAPSSHRPAQIFCTLWTVKALTSLL